VAALEALYKRGEIRVPRTNLVAAKIAAAAAAAASASTASETEIPAHPTLEMDRI